MAEPAEPSHAVCHSRGPLTHDDDRRHYLSLEAGPKRVQLFQPAMFPSLWQGTNEGRSCRLRSPDPSTSACGCQWRLLPREFPPRSTVQRYLYDWRDNRAWQHISDHVVMASQKREGQEPSPSAGAIDNQSGCTTESGGPREFDAGKKIKGRKHHVLTDTTDLLISGAVHVASLQHRNGAPDLLRRVRSAFSWLRHVFADGAYSGDKLAGTLKNLGRCTFEVARRSEHAKGFKVLPRRSIVERTLAWLNRNRHLAKDSETTVATAGSWLHVTSIQIMVRRLGRR